MNENKNANELYAALQLIIEIAENTRLSVNAIGESIRQIDVDASSAATRGYCIQIQEIARSAMRRYEDAECLTGRKAQND